MRSVWFFVPEIGNTVAVIVWDGLFWFFFWWYSTPDCALDGWVESHRVIVCHLEIHILHDLFCGSGVQIDGSIVYEGDPSRACGHDLHTPKLIAGTDLQHIIIDQEDIHDLHDVGVGSSEDSIYVAREDRNLFLATDVCGVCIYAILRGISAAT